MDKSCHYFGERTPSLTVIVKAVIGLQLLLLYFTAIRIHVGVLL